VNEINIDNDKRYDDGCNAEAQHVSDVMSYNALPGTRSGKDRLMGHLAVGFFILRGLFIAVHIQSLLIINTVSRVSVPK
jgi:hypothetical protein